MCNRYSLRLMNRALLGLMAMLVAGATQAALNLDTDKGGVIFAKETLTSSVQKNGDTYYVVNEAVGADTVLNMEGKVVRGGFANSEMTITFELHGMAFNTAVVLADLNLRQPDTTAEDGVVTRGTPITVPPENVINHNGAAGDTMVSFIVMRPAKVDPAAVAELDVSSLRIGSGMSGSVSMMVTSAGASHSSNYSGAVRIANALQETLLK